MLGVNPVRYLLSRHGAPSPLTPANRDLLTGREFFPNLISGPFHDGLVLVFAVSAARGGDRPAVDRRDTPAELHPPAQSRAGLT